MINVLQLQPGDQIRLTGAATAEVVSNPRDGVWILVRYLTVPSNPDQEGTEELVFAETIEELM